MTELVKRTRKKKETEVAQDKTVEQSQRNNKTVVKMPDGSTVTTTEKMTIVSY
jgi:hypothetical protein